MRQVELHQSMESALRRVKERRGRMDFKVVRLHRFEGDGSTKAVCDVSIADEFLVKGFRIIEGKKGLFVGFPAEPGKDGKWYNSAFPLTAQAREALNKTVLAAFNENEVTEGSRCPR